MESDAVIYGLLGRIHVLTRRELNRITDVEYMRVNKDYAREIVRLGEADGHPELVELCAKLRVAMELDTAAAAPKTSQGRFFPKLVSSIIFREVPPDQYIGALR
jgi:hypothetical protein